MGKRHRHHTQLVHTTKKKPAEVRSDINVTPLVDVCLVLLIIFMVVMEKLTRGVEVPLPKTRHHEEKRDTGEQLIVSIARDGGRARIYWDRTPLPDTKALQAKVEEELRRRNRPIFLKADADLSYRDVYPVLIALHEAGTPGVQLGTSELKQEGR